MARNPTPNRASQAEAAPVLERRLGPFDAAAVIVSNVIGGGILFTPPLVAATIPHPWLFLGVWAVGGALAFMGAMIRAMTEQGRPAMPQGLARIPTGRRSRVEGGLVMDNVRFTTLSGAEKVLPDTTLESFRARVRGRVLRPGEDGYNGARSVFNAMVDRHPALIVRCAGVADVIAAVAFARDHDLLVSIRGGGH